MPYRVEYASTSRATCKGPQPCAGSKIEKGQLRLGTLTEIQGHHVRSFVYPLRTNNATKGMAWRHWGWYVLFTSTNHMKHYLTRFVEHEKRIGRCDARTRRV